MKLYMRIFASLFTLMISVLCSGNIFDRTLSGAIVESTDVQRPMLLLFTSTSCEPCRAIEQYLQKEEVFAAVNGKYVAAHIDIADFDGKACSQIYGVQQTPALVVAAPDGEVLYHNEGPATPHDIELLLSGDPENITEPELYTGNTNDPDAIPPGTYAIQLGFFSSQENAVRLRDRARKSGYDATYIQDEQRNGKVFYRVLVGPYPNPGHAQSTMVLLDKDGFPVKLHERKS
jgi:thiol-disulfide isomerase/thioredoxin